MKSINSLNHQCIYHSFHNSTLALPHALNSSSPPQALYLSLLHINSGVQLGGYIKKMSYSPSPLYNKLNSLLHSDVSKVNFHF